MRFPNTSNFAISLSVLALALACAISTHSVRAQNAPIEEIPIDVFLESGKVEADGDLPPDKPKVVFSEVIAIPDAAWLRLQFDLVQLSGIPADGNASFLRLTALRDGATQRLDATSILHWRHTSAYFNGNAVLIELLSYPGTGVNSVVVAGGWMGLDDGAGAVASICGPTDDRVPSTNPAIGRIIPAGCTGFLINNRDHCFLTAGHCTTTLQGVFDPNRMQIVEFNVPLSSSSGVPNFAHPDDQYPVDPVSIQFENTGPGGDWCYFGAFGNSNTGLTPLQAQGASLMTAGSMPPVDNSPLRITGYGIDNDPPGSTGNENQWSRTQQTDVGTFDSLESTFVPYDDVDTMGGNSGSPMIKENIATVIGIHTHGGCDIPPVNNNYGQRIDNPALVNALANPQGICSTPQTIHVPADFPTIQQAINAANNGNEIVVAAGTYFENINLLGKEIHLRSAQGPAVTIIDGQGAGTVVTSAGGETQNTILEGFTITAGNAFLGGGMDIVNDSNPTVINCTFLDNNAEWGGGVNVRTSVSGETTFTNCRFIENSASLFGGGLLKADIGPSSGVVHLVNCEFIANTAAASGGGLYFLGGPAPFVTATDCTFIGNVAGNFGGGVSAGGSSSNDSVFTNCHFEGNTAGGGGGAFFNGTTGSSIQLIDCAFIDNSASSGSGGAIANQTSSPIISGCEFKANVAAIYGGAMYNFINADPQIDTTLFCENTPSDIEGPWSDQGGNQFSLTNCPGSGNTLYVPADYPTIQAAINAASNGEEIIVAPGTYFEHINFLGKEIHLRSAQGPAVTIIDGQGTGTVVTCAGGETQSTILEGFTITGGNGGNQGGGIHIANNSSPNVFNCTFIANTANRGGGVRVSTSLSTQSTFTGCSFIENSAARGGGLYKDSNSVVHLVNCEFIANTASERGGGLHRDSWGAAPFVTATDCTFIGNDASIHGGGVYNAGASGNDTVFTNCHFEGNTAGAPGGGGGLYNNSTGNTTQLIGCTFIDNSAGGGGAIVNLSSSPIITGCEFMGNSASFGGAMHNWGTADPAIDTTLFCENTPDDIFGNWADLGGNQFSSSCHCPGDFNGDGEVNVQDLLIVLAAWGPCSDCNNCPADIDGDCFVNVVDLLIVLANWGPCP